MPELRLISATGTAQRRLLEENCRELEKNGYVMSARQEGGEWQTLLADNLSGGLFNENRYVVVEDADSLGMLPDNLSSMVEPEASVVLLLVCATDVSKLIPKEILKKCRILKAEAYPRWANERQRWVEKLAREMNVNLARDATALIVELTEDPEEIRGQLKTLSALRQSGQISVLDVQQFCLDDGSNNLLRLLDGICRGEYAVVMKTLAAMQKAAQSGDLIKLTSALHNRFRLAMYASLYPRLALSFKQALAARDYAWRLAEEAGRRYGARAMLHFVIGLLKLNAGEKSGTANGWHELEFLVIELFGK